MINFKKKKKIVTESEQRHHAYYKLLAALSSGPKWCGWEGSTVSHHERKRKKACRKK